MKLSPIVPALAAALLVAAGCGTGTTPSKSSNAKVGELDPNAKVTLTWWHGQTADAAELLAGFAKEYHEKHPNVTINAASGASSTDALLTKLQAGLASDTYPDISYAFGSWATELGASGRTLDISEQVRAPDSGWTEFPPAATATATVDGKVIGMPAIVGDLALIYNTKLFDEAGIDYPTADWTWDDFRTAAKALTDKAKNQYGTAYPVNGSEDTTWRFWPQLWQNGGSVLEGDKATFNSSAGVDALEYWRKLAVDDKSVYLDQTGEKYLASFLSGHIGMVISGPWMLYSLQEQKTPYGVQILPGTDGDHQTISGPDLWVLFNHDDPNRAAAAYDFINWLTAPEQDVRWNVKYGNLPLRSSAASTPEFQAYTKNFPGGQVFFDNLKNATTPRPTVLGYTELSREIGNAISRVLLDQGDPREELDKAAKAASAALAAG